MRRVLVATIAVIHSMGLSGCSLFVPKLEKPTLSVVSVRMLKGDLWHQELKVRMRVQNPNDRALPVKGLSYELDVDGQDFAHGISGDSFVVPARGEAEFDLGVSANMASMLIKVLGQGGKQIDYHLTGKISLSAGLLRSFTFNEHGTFSWQ